MLLIDNKFPSLFQTNVSTDSTQRFKPRPEVEIRDACGHCAGGRHALQVLQRKLGDGGEGGPRDASKNVYSS